MTDPISVLTEGARAISQNLTLQSKVVAGSYTIGGSTADISTYSGNINVNTSGGAAMPLNVSAASGGRVNFTGNIVRGSGATGTGDSLTKTDTGIVSLAGTNSYQGTTTVTAGTLLINGTLGNTGEDVGVANGATVGGNGTINRSLTVANGGILSAGDMSGTSSLVGTLTLGSGGVTSGLILNDESFVRFDLQQGNFTVGGAVNDLITVGGALTLDGTLQITELGGSLTNGNYRLFNYTGTLTDNTLVIDAAFLATHVGSTIDTSIANQVNLTVVPEPSSAVLLLAGVGLTFLLVMRKRTA